MIIDPNVPMIGGFKYNGIASQSFKCVGRSVSRPLLPTKKQKRTELVGASGVFDFAGSEYELRPIKMRIIYVGTNYFELRSRARSIAAWLSYEDYAPLIMDDEPDKYYLAKVTSELNLDHFWESGTVEVEFDCQPFAYSVEEQTVNISSGGSFNNIATRRIDYRSPPGSKFLVNGVLLGNSISITMNGQTLSYDGDQNGSFEFDNIEMTFKVQGQNKFKFLSGDIDTFLHINPGTNTVTYSASTDGGISIRYIPMWY